MPVFLDFELIGRDYSTHIESHLEDGNLLEIGNGVTTLSLPECNRTLAVLIYPGKLHFPFVKLHHQYACTNALSQVISYPILKFAIKGTIRDSKFLTVFFFSKPLDYLTYSERT